MIVVVGSVRGAPGATSMALLLAAAWPSEHRQEHERVVLEADPAGGVLGARYGLGVDPGAVSLLAALRRPKVAPVDIDGHARVLRGGVWVVPGPESGTQARAIWNADLGASLSTLAADRRVWLVDVGRFDDSGPSALFSEHAALGVVVCGPHVEDLVQVPDRVGRLRTRSCGVAVVVSGRTPYADDELARFTGADAAWRVADAPDLFAEAGQALFGRRGRRSWAWRDALRVASGVAGLLGAQPGASHRAQVQEALR